MTTTEMLVIAGGLVVGYWLISRLIAATGRTSPDATGPRDWSSPGASVDSQWIQTHWHEVLGVRPSASVQEIKAAYDERLRHYQPDRTDGLGPELRAMALRKTQELNLAYTWALGKATRA